MIRNLGADEEVFANASYLGVIDTKTTLFRLLLHPTERAVCKRRFHSASNLRVDSNKPYLLHTLTYIRIRCP